MGYTIDLIDTVDNSHVTILHRAGQDTVELAWRGADAKGDLLLVPTFLNFTLVDPENQDAAFLDLFTTNETRFKVRMYEDVSGDTIYNGFILPDQYSEPYTNQNTFVKFTASDGMGRLKGKYLPDEFYSEEKSVIELIANCILLTGLELEIFFLPAIENIEKPWHEIYVPGTNHLVKDKKKDAHTILSDLLFDMVSCVYQADDKWYVEGLNRRHIRQNSYKHYSAQGIFINEVEVLKNLKKAVPVPIPDITQVPPYAIINVTNAVAEMGFDKNTVVEENKGWAVLNNADSDIVATAWAGSDGYDAIARFPDYDVLLPISSNIVIDFEKYVELSRKVFLKKGEKYTFQIEFEVLINEGFGNDFVDTSIALGFWNNVLRFEIFFNGAFKTARTLSFGSDKIKKSSIDFLPENDVELDVRIYRPNVEQNNGVVDMIQIKGMSIHKIGYQAETEVSESVSDEYSLIKEVPIIHSDDEAYESASFRLEKLEGRGDYVKRHEVPVLYSFSQENINYAAVGIIGASLIDENREHVHFLNVAYVVSTGGTSFPISDVIYNYQTGEEMLVVTPVLVGNESIYVDVYKTDSVIGSRSAWQQWTDSIYKIERKRYAEAVASVYARMYSVPHHKIDMEVKQAVKFSDFILFYYQGEGHYPVINCTWNVSKNRSTITVVKSFYQSDVTTPNGNIPPAVDAGEDQEVATNRDDAQVYSNAYDPDGLIVSYDWVKLSGPSGDTMSFNASGSTLWLSGLTVGEYVYQVTVTDNEGGTASDTVKISKPGEHHLGHTLLSNSGGVKKFQVHFSPEILTGASVKISGRWIFPGWGTAATRKIKAWKNGALFLNVTGQPNVYTFGDFQFNYIAGSVVEFEMTGPTNYVTLDKGEFVAGSGVIKNTPQGLK